MKSFFFTSNLRCLPESLPCPSLISFLFPSWRAVWSYWPHLEERDSIWGDDWSHSSFIRRSPSWGFLGVSLAVRQMPGDLCTAPRIILLSPSLASNVIDATLGASVLWLGTRTGDGGTTTLTESFFGRSTWLHGQQDKLTIVRSESGISWLVVRALGR